MTATSESYTGIVNGGNCMVATKLSGYKFAQFHVHTPSEHTIDGKVFDGEIHFVHKKADGSAALVVGLFLQKTDGTHTESVVVDAISAATRNSTIPTVLGAYSKLLGSYINKGHVFNYAGSLTTPPCTEFVDWWVIRTPARISSSQFDRIHKTLAKLEITDEGKNARPVQPLNGRFINGEWVEGRSEEYFAVVDPATEGDLAHVACMGKEEAHEAIAAAYVAQRRWKKVTPPARSVVMTKWLTAIVENAEDLAIIASCESAKPLEEARVEVAFAAGIIEYYAHEIVRTSGYSVTPSNPDKMVFVMKEPIGVCAIISPWNFPYATVTRALAPCVASGCAAVVKPSGKTPLSMLALAKLAEDAGVPAGVVNVVTAPRGSPSGIGKELTENPDIRLVAFTGSTSAGKKLMKQASATVKHVVLELGGNAPFIVFEDADIEKALDGLIASKFRNSGQTCVTTNRIFVESNIFDRFAAKLVERVKHLKIGLPFEHGVKLGPLIGPEAVENVAGLVEDAVKCGAKVLIGGNRSDLGKNFYEATVLTNVNKKMRIWKEEIFGPVVPLFPFSSEEEVIRKANDTTVGLAGYFYTQDVSRVFRIAGKLETGMVAVNAGVVSIIQAPFGGVKESGIGREGSHEGLDEYLESKMVCIGGLT